MKSLADELPPEISRQINPEWRKNEAAYWAVRDQLLGQYRGQWIGFADGLVIATGTSPVAVFHAAEESGRHPFVTCVGREDEPCRMRRASFSYDGSYPGEPLPILSVEFRSASGSPGTVLDRVIADTGADASALPWADCLRLHLDFAQGRPSQMAGVAGGTAMSLLFRIWVYYPGKEDAHRARSKPDAQAREWWLSEKPSLARRANTSAKLFCRGNMSMGKNTPADCKRTSSVTNAFWAVMS